MLTLRETAKPFSWRLPHSVFLVMHESSGYFASSSAFYLVRFLLNSSPKNFIVVSHSSCCGFNRNFLISTGVVHPLPYFFFSHISSFVKCLLKFLPIFKLGNLFSYQGLRPIYRFIYSGPNAFVRYKIYKHFFPSLCFIFLFF